MPASTIAVNPKQVTDPIGTAQIFATVLGLDDERRDELAAAMAATDAASSTSPARSTTDVADTLAALDVLGVDDLPRGPADAAGRRHRRAA